MFLDAVGIILKKDCSSYYKMVVLDKVRGKINCVTTTPSFSVGTLITYNVDHNKTTCFIKDSTLLYSPLFLAQTDILFFHHILELIYYFTHIGNAAHDIFNLLAFLYACESAEITIQFKKIFLLKLLTAMGITPENDDYKTNIIPHLSSLDIKYIHTANINNADEKKLDKWLWYCVWQHPYVKEFKTVHFLAKNRAL